MLYKSAEDWRKAAQKRIMLFFDQVKVVDIPHNLIKKLDPNEKSFQNINTPEDYFRLRGTLTDSEEQTQQPRRTKQGC